MLKNLVTKFFEISRFYKRIITVIADLFIIAIATYTAFYIRVDYIQSWLSPELYYSVLVTMVSTIFIASRIGLYRAVIRFIDTKALSTIFIACLMSGAIFVFSSYLFNAYVPRSVPFIYTSLLLILIGASRLVTRGLINAHNSKDKCRVLIYGAGASGHQLALSLQHGAEFSPIAFVDDSKELQKVTVAGLKVYSPENVKYLVDKYGVRKVLLAMPSVATNQRKKLLNQLEHLSVEILTIPGTADLVSGKLTIDALRKVDIADLLGREAVKPIELLFKRCIDNKNVMVTGAGGSIGSEICRQIVRQNPTVLVLFEASEFALYSIEKELREISLAEGYSFNIIPILANVQDNKHVECVINTFSVNTIYHAAAYKHVPIVEHNVISGIRNNVWGTLTCAQAAQKCNVENFVLISTDKAVRPTNVMGASKRLAELCLQALAEMGTITNFSMVRFGNVLGSSGSVVPLFKKQISMGGPVTITHPDINRYFMTIPEAAQLVIQAGSMGNNGEVYVLDMGSPVKISDLAEKMIHLSGLTVKNEESPDGDIEICYTGLRPGEKLYEELLIGESVSETEHPRIMKARELSISWGELDKLLLQLKAAMDNEDIALLRKYLLAAPLGFNPSSDIADCLWLSNVNEKSDNDKEHLRLVRESTATAQ